MKARLKVAVSIALIFTTAFSALLFQSARPAMACPIPVAVPTLYDLYNSSSLIVTAELTSVDAGRIMSDEPEYKSVEVTRNLRVMTVHKGAPPKQLSYKEVEVRFNNREESEESRFTDSYGYQGFRGMAVGEKYIFFFESEVGTRDYKPIRGSGVKWLSEHDLNVHEARLAELSEILKNPKDKNRNLTDWVVRLIEEPTTRWDGVFELHKSWAASGREVEEDGSDAPVMLFSMGRGEPLFKENLTDSQREFISSLAFQEINDVLGKGDYLNASGVAGLAANWEKARLSEYALSLIPGDVESDRRKTANIVNAVAMFLDDDVIWELASEFTTEDDPKNEPNKTEKTVPAKNLYLGSEEFQPDPIRTSENEFEIGVSSDQQEFELVEPEKPSKMRAAVIQKLREEFGFLVANNFERPETEEDSEN